MAHYLTATSRASAALGSTDPIVREKGTAATSVSIVNEEDALNWLNSEFPNLFACIDYAIDEQLRPYCWELPLALGYFVQMRGLLSQGLEIFAKAKVLAASNSRSSLARTLTWLACFARHAGMYQSAKAYLREAAEIPAEELTAAVRAQIFRELGLLDCATGELGDARVHYDTAISLAVAADDKYAEGYALVNSGIAHKLSGEYDEAATQMNEAYAIGSELRISRLQAVSSYELGSVSIQQHDHDNARSYLDRALTIYEGMGNGNGMADVHLNIGMLELDLGNIRESRKHLTAALNIYVKSGYRRGEADVYSQFARLAEYEGDEATREVHKRKADNFYKEIDA